MTGKGKDFDGASPAKIFVGGLPKETTIETFRDHFGKYGNIIDSVIMTDRVTRKPRGFGFITYDDPSVVDQVIDDTHIIHGKQVEIKRTIPKGAAPLRDFKTKKIFVGGLPSALKEDEFRDFFSHFGKISDSEIIRDHATSRSRGFGFIVFDSEKTVDELLAKKGNMIDLSGTQVEIKKAEPKKPTNNPPPSHSFEPNPNPNPRAPTRQFSDPYETYPSYSSYGGGGPSFGPYRSSPAGVLSSRSTAGGSAYGGEFAYGYGGGLAGYNRGGDSSLGYSSRFSSYGGNLGGGYGSYGRETGGYGGSYDSFSGGGGSSGYSGYGGPIGGGGMYGSRGGSSGGASGGSSRYHPYTR